MSGVINKIYPLIETPAKVKVLRFILEHNSLKQENLHSRKVFCRMYCVLIGQSAGELVLGKQVMVNGFLNTNSKQQLVLHVQKIN